MADKMEPPGEPSKSAIMATPPGVDADENTASYEACHKTLNTAELLEMILLNVDDLQALLLSQRVNRMFQATIATSKHLQKELWLEIKDDEEAEPNKTAVGCRQIYVIDAYYGYAPDAPPLPYAPPNTTFSSLFKKQIDVAKGRFLQFIDRGEGHCRDHTIILHRDAFSSEEMSRTWRSMLFKGFGDGHDGLVRFILLPEDEERTARISHAEGTIQRLVDDLGSAVEKMDGEALRWN
ncbi:hypothetical protein HII31_12522 [Pseudocercospora fuligena]|uniref:F-box domain-containing protein n=1 Tax=Pseudocercospora fuligena TaxID=685502 RepID=A0A8H6VGM7_9PEZI|nr:hypothetical protein HII31_12522 [Pseudocercospora fuligena]